MVECTLIMLLQLFVTGFAKRDHIPQTLNLRYGCFYDHGHALD